MLQIRCNRCNNFVLFCSFDWNGVRGLGFLSFAVRLHIFDSIQCTETDKSQAQPIIVTHKQIAIS